MWWSLLSFYFRCVQGTMINKLVIGGAKDEHKLYPHLSDLTSPNLDNKEPGVPIMEVNYVDLLL